MADRSLLPEGTVTALARAIPIEFAVVHASGFLAWPWVARTWPFRRRALFVAGLAGLYSLALGIASLALGGVWPLAIFWGLMLNRMLVVLVKDAPADTEFGLWAVGWAGGTTLYVLSVVVGVFGGQTDATKALVMGFLYFTMMALSELTGWGWVYRWQAWAQRRSGR